MLLLLPAMLALHVSMPGGMAPAIAQDSKVEEKDAFQTAKDLGTADAWKAFLGSYPTGFHADMARAYLKKVEGDSAGDRGPTATAPAPTPSSARAIERTCAEQDDIRSPTRSEPSKITFVNSSGMYRAIAWITSEGHVQDYGGINSGDQVTYDTYGMHAWMIMTGPGDCLQIFQAAAEPSTVDLKRLAADDGKAAAAPRKSSASKPVKESKPAKKKPLVCAKNYKLKNGRCVLLQNCGKNARRNPEGDCHCNKGYQMKGGKCVWPQDKQGFEVAPWKKGGCKSLQSQCSKGNGQACMKYEETCQVN